MKSLLFSWLVLCVVTYSSAHIKKHQHVSQEPNIGGMVNRRGDSPDPDRGHYDDKKGETRISHAKECMGMVNRKLKEGNRLQVIKAIDDLEKTLAQTMVNDSESLAVGSMLAMIHRPRGPFRGLEIHASDSEVSAVSQASRKTRGSKVSVRLPSELDPGPDSNIVFCMITSPETNGSLWGDVRLYENRLVGLSVQGKNVSGLQEHVNITVNLTTAINETQEPECMFLNLTTKTFSSDGCQTVWDRGQGPITCLCDHLTYFAVLMVSASIPPTHQTILVYITLIGCSLSLVTLIVTVLLFITKRHIRTDISMKVHINLVIALILLNLHLLPSQAVASLSSSAFCLYMAVALHYSLLATFSWMALEGFHIYLLLVRVFNIYIRKYMLKMGLVGWGVPAVIVSLVIIVDRDAYGQDPLDASNPNSTLICYIRDHTVKMVTTVGVFSLVFVFNLVMFGVIVRRILSFRHQREFGQSDRDRTKQNVSTLLGVTVLLGLTFGLIFFSFGHLTTPGLYVFCILNSLQGFFIFLWFMMSLKKKGNGGATTGSETRSTSG